MFSVIFCICNTAANIAIVHQRDTIAHLFIIEENNVLVYYTNMSPKAYLFIHEKYLDDRGNISEVKIWIVPVSEHHPYGYKYSLVYIVNGMRVIGFDNESGKGDHLHIGEVESTYLFESIDRLLADYKQAVNTWKEKHHGNKS